jgi:hypothetical protein
MIERINIFFGIKNEVSVPTLISIIVFLSGGFINYLISHLNNYYNRNSTRKTFYLVIDEIVSDLKIKEKQTFRFYPTIKPEHETGWILPYTSVSYLETLFELDFNEIYYSFRKKINWDFCSKKIKNRAFHRIWATLRNLRFFEDKLEKDLENMMSRFDIYHKEYGVKLDEYRKYHDRICRELNGKPIPTSETQLIKYLKLQDNIWVDWQNIEQTKRTAYFITYNKLVKPQLELNRLNQNIDLTEESNNLLLACTYQYIEMENTLDIYQRTFKNYYRNYREGCLILKKCIAILKT